VPAESQIETEELRPLPFDPTEFPDENSRLRLRAATAFIFDMDGVLYRGNQVLPGVNDILNALTIRGYKIMLATNNSTASPANYVEKLAGMGIDVTEDSILTSSMATRDYLATELPEQAGIYVVGSQALRDQLFTETTWEPVQFGERVPDAVVVGLDTSFTYEKLRLASAAIRAGAKFIATNADATLPTEHGLVPGCGSIVAAIAAASGVMPIVIGKPEPLLIQKAVEHLGVNKSDAVMIGDRLDTDIIAGHRAGVLTVLVLTGVSTRSEVPTSPILPDLVFNDLPSLLEALVVDN
jgi:HAD superfamily hydrolase (TIGR01457 family)